MIFFHTSAYINAFSHIPGFSPLILEYSKGQASSVLVGFCHDISRGVLMGVSSRIVIPQLPVYEDIEALQALLLELRDKVSSRVLYTEIRAMKPDKLFKQVALDSGFSYIPHYNVIVKCSNSGETWKAISESKRRQIKKAIKTGVTIEENPTLEQVDRLYDILKILYKIRVHKPLPDRRYFHALYNTKDNPDYYVKFLLVVYQEEVIGGIVAPVSMKYYIHEHYIAGLDYEYKDQYPSVMATWAAIDYACRNGIAEFDFMGAGSPDHDYGVREFKLKFGGELIDAGRYMFIPNPLVYRIATKAFNFIKGIK